MRVWPLGFRGWLERSRYSLEHPVEPTGEVAENGFRRVVSAAPTLPSGHYGLGLALLKGGKRFGAYHAMASASSLYPSNPHYGTAADEVKNLIEKNMAEKHGDPAH